MRMGELIFFCGKMASGKSTKAISIAQERKAVLLCEDEWLASLYPNKISSLDDYIKYSRRLKPQIKKLTQSILFSGTSVVMDFPANTLSQRNWFRNIYTEIDAMHTLIYINLPNDTCLKQLEKRRIEFPERAATDTAEMFAQVTQYFVAPTDDENFNTMLITQEA